MNEKDTPSLRYGLLRLPSLELGPGEISRRVVFPFNIHSQDTEKRRESNKRVLVLGLGPRRGDRLVWIHPVPPSPESSATPSEGRVKKRGEWRSSLLLRRRRSPSDAPPKRPPGPVRERWSTWSDSSLFLVDERGCPLTPSPV